MIVVGLLYYTTNFYSIVVRRKKQQKKARQDLCQICINNILCLIHGRNCELKSFLIVSITTIAVVVRIKDK